MNPLHSLFLLLVFTMGFPAMAASPNGAAAEPSGYEVLRTEFGLFNNKVTSGQPTFVPTTVVPLTPTQGYGWVIQLRTAKPKIKWREEFTLPATPKSWGGPEPLGTRSMSTDGRTSVTEREVSPDQGLIFNSWTVARGDPRGRYVIRVFIEGTLAKVFEFDVE